MAYSSSIRPPDNSSIAFSHWLTHLPSDHLTTRAFLSLIGWLTFHQTTWQLVHCFLSLAVQSHLPFHFLLHLSLSSISSCSLPVKLSEKSATCIFSVVNEKKGSMLSYSWLLYYEWIWMLHTLRFAWPIPLLFLFCIYVKHYYINKMLWFLWKMSKLSDFWFPVLTTI